MVGESLKQKLIRNSFWNFLATGVNRVGGLIFTIILARFLLPEGYGLYSIVLSVAMIFFTFADLGVNGTFLRYLSFALAKEKRKISAYYNYLLKIKLLLALVAAVLLLVLAYPISFYVYGNKVLFIPLVVTAFLVFALAFENFYAQIFYALGRVKYVGLKEFLHQTIRICFALLVFYFVAVEYRIIGIFLGLILTAIILTIFIRYFSGRLMPSLYEKPKERIDKKRVSRFLGFLTIASISSIFFSYIDSLMLGFYVAPAFVGYYRAAFSLIFGIAGLVAFSNIIFLPIFTKLGNKKTGEVLNKSLKYISMLIIPTVFGILILGKYFIKLFYGHIYLPATLPLYFLSFLIFPTVLVGLFLSLFSAKEKPQIFAKLIIVTSILNVILNFVLIKVFLSVSPLWATAGAAIATLISWMFYLGASIYRVRKEFKIKVQILQLLKPLIPSLIMSGVLIYLLSIVQNMTLVWGVALILVGGGVYALIMVLIDSGLRRELKEFKNFFVLKNSR